MEKYSFRWKYTDRDANKEHSLLATCTSANLGHLKEHKEAAENIFQLVLTRTPGYTYNI